MGSGETCSFRGPPCPLLPPHHPPTGSSAMVRDLGAEARGLLPGRVADSSGAGGSHVLLGGGVSGLEQRQRGQAALGPLAFPLVGCVAAAKAGEPGRWALGPC